MKREEKTKNEGNHVSVRKYGFLPQSNLSLAGSMRCFVLFRRLVRLMSVERSVCHSRRGLLGPPLDTTLDHAAEYERPYPAEAFAAKLCHSKFISNRN